MKKLTPESSSVVSIEYNAEKKQLTVDFKYGTYDYTPVPQDVADKAFASTSIGSFVHTDLKGKYVTEKRS